MTLSRFLSVSAPALACAAALFAASPAPAEAQARHAHAHTAAHDVHPGAVITHPGESARSRSVVLGLDKSTVVELARPAADVVITNPAIADAVVQTNRRIIFRGMSPGQTNALIFDREGRELLSMELTVEHDLAGLGVLLRRHVPDARVAVEGVNGNILVTGMVDNLLQQDLVMRLVTAYVTRNGVAGEDGIVNMLRIDADDQVMLEVRIVEMQRSVVKQLGINLSGSVSFGDLATVGATAANGFGIAGAPLGGLSATAGYLNTTNGNFQSSVGAAVDALERVGLVRILAEPNVVAISGETAKFLAGGEFPVPVGADDGQIQIGFKSFGVGLAFTPVVLSEGRISLKVSTEVSELSNQGALQGSAGAVVDGNGNVVTVGGFSIPSLAVRRAESTVELGSGNSMMLAGLIQSRSRQTLDKIPGIGNLPVLGALFQSRDFQSDETELVILITPYLVDPARKGDLRTPGDGYRPASDARTVLFGELNALYGRDGVDFNAYQAPVGFIEE